MFHIPSKIVRYTGLSTMVMALLAVAAYPAGVRAQEPVLPVNPYDVSRNGVVNDSDVQAIFDAITLLQSANECMRAGYESYDFNGDGCIDIGDAQLVAAQWGISSDPNKPAEDAPQISAAAIFTVNSTGDGSDSNPGDGTCSTGSGTCTLRAAIQEANANSGRDTIEFNLRNSDGSCKTSVTTLTPQSTATDMLTLDDVGNAGTIIDGYSQCDGQANGAKPNTQNIDKASDGRILIEVEGTKTAGVYGISIPSDNNTVRGLAIRNWDDNIFISGGDNNFILGNYIGTNAANSGRSSRPSGGDGNGIDLRNSARGNQIGDGTPAGRNIIAGNGEEGIRGKTNVTDTRVRGNYIGLKKDGITRLANNADGADFNVGSINTIIGGPSLNERNVISGNGEDGIEIAHNEEVRQTGYNKIINNYIGVSAFGGQMKNGSTTATFGNGLNGITFEDQVHDNELYGNVIANNGANGVRFYYKTNRNNLHDNWIGAVPNFDSSGQVTGYDQLPNGTNTDPAAVARGDNGVLLLGDANLNRVANNVIAYNLGDGIKVSNQTHETQGGSRATDFNTFSRNYIFDNDGLGINISPSDGDYPNLNIPAPTINSANTGVATGLALNPAGAACNGCTIEIFISDKTSAGGSEPGGEGKIFIGSGTTDSSGRFTVAISGVAQGQLVTATTTDTQGNTSEFAKNVVVQAGPVAPTPTPTTTPVPPTPTPNPNLPRRGWLPSINK